MSWFGRGKLAKMLPAFAEKWVHNLQFRPLRPHTMEPGPEANWVPKGVPRITGYRQPAPGSRPIARIPRVESSDEVFENNYYSRDTQGSYGVWYLFFDKDPDGDENGWRWA